MSSHELADTVRALVPFTTALNALVEKVEEFSSLDQNIDQAKSELASLKSEQAQTKSETARQLKLAQDATEAARKQTEESNRLIASDRQKHTDAMTLARKQAADDSEAVRVNASSAATLTLKKAQDQADQIVNEAKAEAEAIKSEVKDLAEKLPATRQAHAEASALLADINAKIDAIRSR